MNEAQNNKILEIASKMSENEQKIYISAFSDEVIWEEMKKRYFLMINKMAALDELIKNYSRR